MDTGSRVVTELPEVLIGMTDGKIRVGELSLPHRKGTESVLTPEARVREMLMVASLC